jgi:predicted metalloprotease with PDZ domain
MAFMYLRINVLLILLIFLIVSIQVKAQSSISLAKEIHHEASLLLKPDTEKQYLDLNSSAKYLIRPLFVKNHIVISIDALFKTSDTSQTFVGFVPCGSCNPHAYLTQSIRTLSTGTTITRIGDSQFWEIHHKPRQTIHLQYFIIQDSIISDQQDLTWRFPAIFTKNYCYLENASLFALPTEWLEEGSFHTRKSIGIEWQTDSTWRFANSFGANQHRQLLHISAKDILRSMTICSRDTSKCSISSWTIGKNQQIYLATTEEFTSRNNVFSQELRKIAESSVHFWQDTSPLSFLTTLIPVVLAPQDEETGVIGFANTNGFVGFFSHKREQLNYSGKYLFTHEMLHKWMSAERFPEQDFSGFGYCALEGFTDYLARHIMLKKGIVTHTEYLKDCNTMISSYCQSQYKNIAADSIQKYFARNIAIKKLPYYRGDILAHIWANEIRKHTGDKHDFATALRDIVQQNSGTVIIDQIFAKALETYIGRNVIDDILKYMKNGETIPIPPDMIPFARLSTKQDSTGIPQFECIAETK